MLRLGRLLVPTDLGPRGEAALALACELAALEGGEVHLLHVFRFLNSDDLSTPDDGAGVEELRRRLERQEEARLSAAAQAAPAGVTVEPVQIGSPAVALTIVGYAEEWGADLLVMGTHARRGLGHLLLGSIAEEVLRRTSCPVLTFRLREAAPSASFRRLLVPVDFSPHTLPLLREAGALAARFGSGLDLVHAIEGPALPTAILGFATVSDLVPELERRARQRLEGLVREAGLAVPVEVHVVRGHPAAAVAELARQRQADLVVIARQGASARERFALGHVTERVVRTAPCPVLTLPTVTEAPAGAERESGGAGERG